jgi:cytochrome c-type biogenesis protein CcsB
MSLAVGVLVVIVVALALGTVIESMRGAEVALRLVYGSIWFRLLLGLFAVNLACSLIDLWPWGRGRIGFVMTHGSILLILMGSLATDLFKVEGRLAVWEGEERETIVTAGPLDAPVEEHALPFSIHLDAFEIDYYQGTRRPAMFRSRVTVIDPAAQRTFPAVIEMNRELSYAGYHLYQSSYQQTAERDQTILLVSRDPGQAIVFTGYILMMVGMTTVLVTRIAQRRGALRNLERQRRSIARQAAALLAGLAVVAGGTVAAHAASEIDPATIEKLRGLPVQHDGRVMPLDTLAREATRKVTGRQSWHGLDAVAVVLGWTFDPDRWVNEPLLPLGGRDLASVISLPSTQKRASFLGLAKNPQLMALFGEARAEEERGERLGGVLKQAQELEGRMVWMQGFLKKSSIRPLPSAEDPEAVWSAPAHLHGPEDLLAVRAERPASAIVSGEAIDREIRYNAVRPSRLSWWILAVAAAVSVLAWNRGGRWLDLLAVAGLLAGFAVMTWGLALRWQIAGRIPASNMYESLLFLAWGVGLFALVALIFLRNRLVVFNATAMSALTMALADLLPIDPFIHPMPPVLSGTAWLAIHVPIIMVSYSVLALGVLIAHMQIGVAIVAPQKRELASRMNDLLYWYMHIGAILLIAGILTGSIWAASSWGRYWGWDPKEVWSLVAFLAYLAILHGRFDRLIAPFGVAALSIIAFWTIVMTYIGVNYVLAAGLHSYGFGGSGVVRWMMIVAVLEGLFLVVGWLSYGANSGRKEEITSAA